MKDADDLIVGLKKSRKLVGELQPIIKNQYGETLVGNHRIEAYPTWSSTTVEQRDELHRLMIILHGSFQRRLSRKEVMHMHLDLAKVLEERGTPKTEIAGKVAELSPYSKRYVLKLLPDYYKEPEKVHAGKKRGELVHQKGQKTSSISKQNEIKKDYSTISLQRKKALEKYTTRSSKIEEELKNDMTAGNEASVVFGMLEKGKQLADIVIETKIPPDRVNGYYDQWVEFKEKDVNAPSVPKKVKEIEENSKRAHERIDCMQEVRALFRKNNRCLTSNMYENLKCIYCGATHRFAIHYRCTYCAKEGWWGWNPR